jgi:hypothetical protein
MHGYHYLPCSSTCNFASLPVGQGLGGWGLELGFSCCPPACLDTLAAKGEGKGAGRATALPEWRLMVSGHRELQQTAAHLFRKYFIYK